MQLVLRNNQVIAHGEGFLSMGGVVINPETGAKYEGATIAECDSCPSDIGKVGYEYRAGIFTPCAPYGKGDGTIPVLCDDECKATKDSGIPLESFCLVEKKPYTGLNSVGQAGGVTLTFNHPPFMVFIKPKNNNNYMGYVQGTFGLSFFLSSAGGNAFPLNAVIDGNSIRIYHANDEAKGLNLKGTEYEAIALCIRGL